MITLECLNCGKNIQVVEVEALNKIREVALKPGSSVLPFCSPDCLLVYVKTPEFDRNLTKHDN